MALSTVLPTAIVATAEAGDRAILTQPGDQIERSTSFTAPAKAPGVRRSTSRVQPPEFKTRKRLDSHAGSSAAIGSIPARRMLSVAFTPIKQLAVSSRNWVLANQSHIDPYPKRDGVNQVHQFRIPSLSHPGGSARFSAGPLHSWPNDGPRTAVYIGEGPRIAHHRSRGSTIRQRGTVVAASDVGDIKSTLEPRG
ncbi:hypothetical protein C8J56DRAFT_887140 [Mycena floridula]|nr:hypothetical protein C8J56DRAFT_887140 [Mycena floridula]